MELTDVKFFTVSACSLTEALSMAQAVVSAFSFVYDVVVLQDANQGLWFITIYGKDVE